MLPEVQFYTELYPVDKIAVAILMFLVQNGRYSNILLYPCTFVDPGKFDSLRSSRFIFGKNKTTASQARSLIEI